jgi:signal transduction histidine kinase
MKDPIYFLLVDDLEENLLSLEALLRQDGLVILKARSGSEALEYLLKYEVALALLDVQMPQMDGFELAELMRGSERTCHVPIIFLTAGSADSQRRFRGYDAGAVDFLHKPIDAHTLRSKAKVFFDLHKQKVLLARQRDELKLSAAENSRLLEESLQYSNALKEADRRKDEFLATLAHELRNPLAPIRNGLNVLRLSNDQKINAEVRDMMERQMAHLIRLIDDLMDVSRVSQGKIDLRTEVITIQSVIQAAVEASRPLINASGHKLTLQVSPEDIWLKGDLTRLSQTLGNLLNNAAKYTPHGGGIYLTVTSQDNELVVSVEDTGMGINRDMLERVFDLFTQADHSLDRSQGGLGIGLALVKRLVEMHKGRIYAESAGEGKGSKFTMVLPIFYPSESPKEATPSETDEPLLNPLKILVVDDNVESAMTTSWMLELIGHEAILSHDGLDAIAKAKDIKPDVVLLDIGLPGMNGYEVCRELRKDAALKDILIVAQTGWGQPNDKKKAKDFGFDHHLTKPINMEQLSALLNPY